jgi:hypothetical protein
MMIVWSILAGRRPEHAQKVTATASNTAKLSAAFDLESRAARTLHPRILLQG